MDFDLTDDQAMLRDSLRRLVACEYPLERRKMPRGSPHGCSPKFWRFLADQGIFSLGFPEDVGGHGGPVEIMLVMEELGRGLVLEPFMSTVVMGGGLIRDYGTVAQRAQLLPRIAAGDCRVAVAHHEAGARYVLDHVSTTAKRGKGWYVLTGTKAAVLEAPLAHLLIVSARDESAGGLSLFLVDPKAKGLTMTGYGTQDGRSAADLTLAGVKVPTAARLGSPGFALTALEKAVDCAVAASCAEAVGVMEALNEATLIHLNTRRRPGQQPRMTDMFLMTMQAKSMSLLATARCRETDRAERRRVLSAAKVLVGKAARVVGQQALLIHGAIGMAGDATISRYCRRLAIINTIFAEADPHSGVFGELLRAQVW